jgi:XapX domain-containing protein
MVVKVLIGLVLAVCIGVGCRWFGIPLPGPPAILGALLAVAMATGYTVTDKILTSRRAQVPSTTSAATRGDKLPLPPSD